MSGRAKISIITPSYNRLDLLPETAKSIWDQTYTNWEWVVVDDGSTDGTWELLESYAEKDNRVKVLQRQRGPKGACTCRNIAIGQATGDYLIFLDSDDVLAPFCLKQRLAAFKQQPDADFLIFSMLLFREKPGDQNVLWNVDNGEDDLLRLLYGDPICQGSATLWKKSSFVALGLWNEELLLWQDIELHLRAFTQGLRYHKRLDLPPDLYIRTGNASLSRTGFHNPGKLRSRVKVVLNALAYVKQKTGSTDYQPALFQFFLGVFTGALRSKEWRVAYQLYCTVKQTLTLDTEQRNDVRRLFFAHALRLYKLTGVQRNLKSRLDKYTYKKAQLHQVHYIPERNQISTAT